MCAETTSEAFFSQQPPHQIVHDGIVVDDQDGIRSYRSGRLLTVAFGRRRVIAVVARGLFHHCRELRDEGRPLAQRALDDDVASHDAGESATDREAEASAAVLPRGRCIRLSKLLEQLAICSGVMPIPVSRTRK